MSGALLRSNRDNVLMVASLLLHLLSVRSIHAFTSPNPVLQHPTWLPTTGPERKRSKQSFLWSSNDKDEENENDTKEGRKPSNIKSPVNMFEGAVQQITGDSDYKFGDYTKKTLSDLTGKDIEKEGYEFGDITKRLVTVTGQAVTGDENYQFGDFTKAKLAELEEELESWRNDTFRDLPTAVWRQLFQGLTLNQRRALVVAIIQMMAIALLSWGVVSNLCTSGLVTAAWIRTCWKQQLVTIPLTPFRNTYLWQSFMSSYSTLRLVLDPFLLVIKGMGTLMLFPRYQRFVSLIQLKWLTAKQRKAYPLVYRVAAMGIAFLLTNVVAYSLVAGTGVVCGSTAVRLMRRLFG